MVEDCQTRDREAEGYRPVSVHVQLKVCNGALLLEHVSVHVQLLLKVCNGALLLEQQNFWGPVSYSEWRTSFHSSLAKPPLTPSG